MSYKIIVTAAPGETLGGLPRYPPLPDGVKACCVEAVGNHGYHHDGDRWVEYFYDTPRARREHLLMLERR